MKNLHAERIKKKDFEKNYFFEERDYAEQISGVRSAL